MNTNTLKSIWQSWNVVIICMIAKFIIHLISYQNYGYHRDEMLYVMLGEHPDWGYLSVPPFIAFIGSFARTLFGETLLAVRLMPILIGVIMVWLVGAMTRELGGNKKAQLIACIGFLLTPAYLGSNHLFQPVSFNQFFWTLTAFWLIKYIKTQDLTYWIYIGITAGIGLMNKYSMAFFLLGLVVALSLTPHREVLKTKFPWIGAMIALFIFLPNLIWQYSYDWPVIEHMQELSSRQLVNVNPLNFITDQFVMQMGSSILWVSGLIYLFISPNLKSFRIIGFIFLSIILLLFMLSGKSYYTLGAFPMLIAAGGVAIEQLAQKRESHALAYSIIIGISIVNLIKIPYALPILPVKQMISYGAWMSQNTGLKSPLRWEDGNYYSLRQDYADMHGWDELAEKVSSVYHSLPDEEQQKCIIFAGSYGHASAIRLLGDPKLPEPISFNASFLLWAPLEVDFTSAILVDDGDIDIPELEEEYESVEKVGEITSPYARERGLPIYLLRHSRVDQQIEWTQEITERRKARIGRE